MNLNDTAPADPAHPVPDQSGRTFVITGGNSGIGLETARVLASRGATVVLAVRDLSKGERAAAELTGKVEVQKLDLSDLASVRDFAQNAPERIDVLVNNAGIMNVPYALTADGFESQFGVNHLGHFALTNLLLPRVQERVVTIASQIHRYFRGTPFADPHGKIKYDSFGAYTQSKLANLLFVLELQRRLTAAGSRVRSLSAHPGYAATHIQGRSGKFLMDKVLLPVSGKLFAQSAAEGARPALAAATWELPGGSYLGPAGAFEARGEPTLVGRSRLASDPALARQLWELSEQETDLKFPAQLDTSRLFPANR